MKMVVHSVAFKLFLPILLLCSCLAATSHISNDTIADDIRQPRVSGRIVKLYTGPRPEPIYCSGEGFQPDPTNCATFYRCVKSSTQKFTVFRFQCGPGTVYDPETEVCNHPRSTKRSECWDNASSSPSTAKYQENEIPKEWFPTELPSPISTSKPLYPDEHLKETIPASYPWTTPIIIPDSLNSGYLLGPASAQKTKPSSQGNDQCTSDGFMGDSENCRKFYRCVGNQRGGFIRYEFSCSEATIWDDDIRSCNHPWAVRKRSCGRSNFEDNKSRETTMEPSNNVDSSISSSQQQTQLSYGSKVSQTQTQISHGSVIQNQTQINYGDRNKKQNEESKQNQTQISYGSAISQTQTQIDHGNKAIQTQLQIDHSKDASQSQTQEYETTSKSPTTQDENQSGQSDTEQSDTQTPSNNYNENKCTESGFMGDKNDCKKFYRCVDNGKGGYTKYDFTCGEGTVWDSEIEACNHAWAVKKCGSQAPETSSQNTVTNQPTLSTQQQTTTTEEEEDVGYGNQNQQPPQTSTTTQNPAVNDNNQNKPEQITSTKRPPDQSDGNECHSSGFMGDKNNCKKFYRCVDNGKGGYTRYEFSCGEGTVWDRQIDTCNHAWAVEKCGGEGSSDIQKEPTSSTQPTMSDEYVDTSQTTQTEKGPEEGTDEGYNQPSPSTTSTTQAPYVSSNNICTQEGFVGDKNNCKKFYRCVDNGKGGYIKYEFTCGEGTVWDQEILGCNHDSGSKQCKSSQQSQSNSTSEGSTENEVSTMPSSTENQQTTQKTESPPQSSSGQCTSEGFYANRDDCKKFYRCVDNGKDGFTKYDFSCGDGTIWVQEIQACDHDNDLSTCSRPNNNSPVTTTTQATDEQAGTSDTSLSTTTIRQSQQPNKEDDEYPSDNSSESPTSDDECTSEGFYPNTNDCRRFYRCVDNDNGGYTKYDFSCGEGTAWDSEIETCNHINEVKGCQSQDTQSNPMQDEDSTQSSSTSSGDGTESSKPTNNDSCEQEGYYGNSEDCKKFYRCVDNGKGGFTKYDFDCGEGTIWDQDITTCNHPQDVSNPSCKQNDSSTSSTTSSTTTSSSIDQSSSSTTENNNGSSDCSQENSSKKPANKNVNCTEAGYYADPDDCKKFYRCVDWDGDGKRFSVYHFECGEGTIWDPALDTCNHEDSVYPSRDCNGSQTQAETVEQESTTTEEPKQEETTTQQFTTEQSTTEQSTTTKKTTESSQENTTAQNEQTTSAEQTTEQTTTQQMTEHTDQTTELAATTQPTTEEQTTSQQMTEQTTQESTTSQQTTSEESYTTESNDQQSTTEQSTESTTQQSTTESETEESQTEESQTEGSQTEESQTEESQTEENETDENLTEENQTEESQTEESQTEESDSTTESSSSSEKECPETDDDQNLFVCPTSFKRHPKYCNLFYQCTVDDDTHDSNIATFHCPNNTIYDESQVKCVEEDKADKKCNGEIAQKRRYKRLDTKHKEPIVVTEERLKCPTVGYFPFEKYECSTAFLKCQKSKVDKIRGYIYQCPQGYVYWSVSRRCELKRKVRDCKHSYNNWNGRWDIPIERRNVAP
ncbi:uncharacterized protein LOC113228424 [Hyposmocoma kahamanoa]|uniref:uncharacterized protein LOC113228424 n=1 Tax=Hyposmocoma kahamanoa TaxID=1477025 RepID=UPI000E6D6F47|nr:uncharacterized protein LOC113228424 [Hyposmocoma kahamanoa]